MIFPECCHRSGVPTSAGYDFLRKRLSVETGRRRDLVGMK
jgi:hypothetical protein